MDGGDVPSVNADAPCCCACGSFVDFSGLCEGESAGRRRTLTIPPQMTATTDSAASPLTVIPAIAPTAKPLRDAPGEVEFVVGGLSVGEGIDTVIVTTCPETVSIPEDVKFDVGVVEVKTVVWTKVEKIEITPAEAPQP